LVCWQRDCDSNEYSRDELALWYSNRPDRRAFGMGIFFTGYYAIMTAGPPIAGWIYDRSGNIFDPIIMSIALFGSVIFVYGMFRLIKNNEKAILART
tara:strand:- start:578 stop:868 length:291 start_codon:yes stop_codon:yes gene_type:complete